MPTTSSNTARTERARAARRAAATAKAARSAAADASPSTPAIDLTDAALYLNRELSLLQFQWRVLEEAQDPRNPLLERVKFVGIVGGNLDEFFMVRVAGLHHQVEAGVVDVPPDGMTPAEQLAAIRKEALSLMRACRETQRALFAELRAEGIAVLDYAELTVRQLEQVKRIWDEQIFPVLTPLAFDPGRPFPFISNLSLNLAIIVRDANGNERFARVKVPGGMQRYLPLRRSSGGVRRDGTAPRNHLFVWLDQVIAAHLGDLFPGMTIVTVCPFRVTRDGDLEIQELEADDLLASIEQGVRRRRFGGVVRVTITEQMSAPLRQLLVDELEMDENDLYVLDGPLGLSSMLSLHGLERPDLKDRPFVPQIPAALLPDGPPDSLSVAAAARPLPLRMFEAMRAGDILVHHPYDSFAPVIAFLEAAARDPQVQAIKVTLYRVGTPSPIVEALLTAIENRKQVAVLVELKARFDEESNIVWARRLEEAGVHVVYGLLGLKTHSKVALVVRAEGEGMRRYVHLATGNYNPRTSTAYTDLGLFTCDEAIGADATDLFNYLTGWSDKHSYRKLLVAPINLRERMEGLIDRETEHAKAGRGGRIVMKMNALVDPGIIRHLYLASQAGVRVDLIVRSISCLRPGVPGVSDGIHVRSIVGRFLEHHRIYYFANAGAEQLYLGSADMMPRNIDRRVEVLFPVEDPRLVQQVRDDILGSALADTVKARELLEDGRYRRILPAPGEEPFNSQERLIAHVAGPGLPR
ncbi:MAG: polyphosphate kinase 1 [Ardenticatenales bacterium]